MPRFLFVLIVLISCNITTVAQPPKGIRWAKDANAFYELESGNTTKSFGSEAGDIVKYDLPSFSKTVIAYKSKFIPEGSSTPLKIRNFFFSNDGNKLLIYTNTKRVWRYDTRGDYWLLDLNSNKLTQMGKSL